VARGNAAPSEQLAAWSETFLLPLVQTIERQVERIEDLARENGRLTAEVDALRAAQHVPDPPTEPEPRPDPFPAPLPPTPNEQRGLLGPGPLRAAVGASALVIVLMLVFWFGH
jgi:hypothetical protein